ncbi:MAG: universal stress protein [Phycisphaerales bacterium]
MTNATSIGPTRIIVPVDGSRAATAALDWAIAAIKSDVGRESTPALTLHIVHVVDVDPSVGLAVEVQAGADGLLAAAADRAAANGASATVERLQGRPWDEIVGAASADDWIVMGARGQTQFDRHRVGATVDRVVRLASCPVLAVPEDGCPAPGTLRSLVVGMDFSSDALAALAHALPMLAPDATVVLVHGTPPPIVVSDGPVTPLPDIDVDGMLADSRAGLQRLIDERLPESMNGVAAAMPVYPVHAIEDAATRHKAELVAVGTHGRRGLPRLLMGSVAERVLHHVDCATLIARSNG